MTCDSSYHNIHHHKDDMVAYSSVQIGLTGLDGQDPCVDCVPGLSDLAYALRRHVEWVATYSWPVGLHITTYTTLRMSFLFSRSSKIRSHSLGVLLGLGWI